MVVDKMIIGTRDEKLMSSEQLAVFHKIASGPRKDVPSPFLAMLDAPEMVDVVQAVGSAIRFKSEMTSELREVAILATAAAFGSRYEWDYHVAIARRLNLPEQTIKAAATGVVQGEGSLYATVISLCRAAVFERRIDPNLLARLVEMTSKRVATEVVLVSGYYQLLGLFLSAAELDRPHRYSEPES